MYPSHCRVNNSSWPFEEMTYKSINKVRSALICTADPNKPSSLDCSMLHRPLPIAGAMDFRPDVLLLGAPLGLQQQIKARRFVLKLSKTTKPIPL